MSENKVKILIRNVPANLHHKVKVDSVVNNISMQAWIIQAMQEKLERDNGNGTE